ncbi:hypothetical protein [Bradyrhizobium sp. STM 3557]|uniref:hypothetical protein n=1 Tax=Bradyrhizobium sp. STM 3557 TaxID=578920 RepID=UPI00388E95F0
MQDVNLPRHLVEALERKWAQKLQQQVATWRSAKPSASSRTASGVVVERRARRPRLATTPATT